MKPQMKKWTNVFVVIEMCVGLKGPARARTASRTVRTFTTLAAARAAAAPGAAIAKYRIQVPAEWSHSNGPNDWEFVSALRGGKLVTA